MVSSKKRAAPVGSTATGRRRTGGGKATARGTAKKKAAARKPGGSAGSNSKKKASARKASGKVAARKTARKTAAKKTTSARSARKRTAKKTTAAGRRKTGGAPRAKKKTPARAAGKARGGGRRAVGAAQPAAIPGLNEEDQIRSAKYLPRDLPKRLFEEDRFVFPESYGVNRVRLLVRDPDWVFAYWDVSPETMKGLTKTLGERALALSRLTLRVLDPVSGGQSSILLPPGARWWYIRTDSARRTYRAEIGITLPSGEFRRLAESNSVVTPRVGPSRERAVRRLSYRGAGDLAPEEAEAAGRVERRSDLAREPWAGAEKGSRQRGGASDVFGPGGGSDRPGASDAFRPGASDTFRR